MSLRSFFPPADAGVAEFLEISSFNLYTPPVLLTDHKQESLENIKKNYHKLVYTKETGYRD